MISQRHSKANYLDLKYVGYYESDKPRRQILYLDANNLYGWAMSQDIPVSDFEWMSDIELALLTEAWITSLVPDGDIGYILEVDLAYPKDLNSGNSDYPLAPERVAVKWCQLSRY